MFSAATYSERRQKLLATAPAGLILLLGNEEVGMNYTDNTYPFRQDSNFLYFLGLDQPGLAVTLDTQTGETILFGEEITIDHVVWMGPQPSLQERANLAGVSKVQPIDKLPAFLAQATARKQPVHYLPPYRAVNQIKLSDWLTIPLSQVKANYSAALTQAVVNLRSHKEAQEVAEMEQALAVTAAMHLAAMREARPGIREAELAGLVEGIALSSGGRVSYPVILTVNGQTLHNHYHGNTLREGQLILGDFGAETAMHYAGDITRTLPVSKQFTAQQREIYQLVLDTEIAAIAAVEPGVSYREIHLAAAHQITTGLRDLGIMQGDPAEAVAAGAHALFFPHGLGHMIGLDVHDMEDLGEKYVGYTPNMERSTQFGLKSLRLARQLEPGFVLTVEPGVYFIPELIDVWAAEKKHASFINYPKLESYRNFSGVRIEDNVLVSETGHRILGPAIPKTIADVEALRQKD